MDKIKEKRKPHVQSRALGCKRRRNTKINEGKEERKKRTRNVRTKGKNSRKQTKTMMEKLAATGNLSLKN